MNRRDFLKNCLYIGGGCAIASGTIYGVIAHKDIFEFGVYPSDTESNSMANTKHIKNIEIQLVDHCNLNCKYCTHFSCIADEEYYEFEKYKKDITKLAEITNSKVQRIVLQGGEPTLHPKLVEIFNYTRELFPDSVILTTTNGILLDTIDETFWEALSKNKIILYVSNYPIKVNWKYILKKVKKYNMMFLTEHSSNEKITLKYIEENKITTFKARPFTIKGDSDALRMFNNCGAKERCTQLTQGKIFQCYYSAYVRHLNKYFKQNFEITSKDYISLNDINDIQELLNFIDTPIPFCKYCIPEGESPWESSIKHELTEWVVL